MAIEVLLGGVNVTDRLDARANPSWSDQVNGRGTGSVTFRDLDGGVWRPNDGAEVLIVDDDPSPLLTSDGAEIWTADDAPIHSGPIRLFGGILQEPTEREDPESDPETDDVLMLYECPVAEFSSICDRRIVTRSYEGWNAGDIVRDIVTRDLDGEGILAAGVEDGTLVEKAVFNDVTVTEALNDLAELAGMQWRIDYNKVLHFRSWAGLTNATPVDGDMLRKGSVSVRRSREKYRNVQIVRAGVDLTDTRQDILVGDGARRAFGTAFPLGSVPTVEESRSGGAWASKTVGILGVEQGKDWYWNVGQAQVSQDDAGTVLIAPTSPADPTTGDRIRVSYRGQFPVKTQYQDLVEIAARQAAEGGSGIYVNVEDKPAINSAQTALDTAVALISRFASIAPIVNGTTRTRGFSPGEVVRVTLPRHAIDEEMLIESMSAELKLDIGEVWYSLTLMSGDPFGGWQEYWRKVQKAGKVAVIGREGEILVLTRFSTEASEADDAIAVSTMAPESRIGIMAIGTGEIGA